MKKIPFIIAIIVLICTGYVVKYRWSGDNWKQVIEGNWDGYGYYAYLPCVFIHHSFDLNKIADDERKWQPGIGDEEIFASFPYYINKHIDKYYVGVAILLTPFFLLAYFLSFIFGYDTGGYSYFFQLSVCVAALFYLTVGLIYTRKLLQQYGISNFITGLSLLLVVMGTNLFFYATFNQSLSHVYTFCAIAIFLYFAKRSINKPLPKNLVRMALAIGLVIIIRPTDVAIVLTIPFLAGSLAGTTAFFKNIFTLKNLSFILLPALLVVSIQFMVWYAETGHFYIWSYQNEGFDFRHPHFYEVTFGYRRGWFMYTPFMFVTLLLAFILLVKRNRFQFVFVALFVFAILYTIASWHFWSFGGSLGQRPLVDFYPFFTLLLALVFTNMFSARWRMIPLLAVFSFCIYANFVQMFQFRTGLMPCDNLDKEKFWKIYLQTDAGYYGVMDTPTPDGTVFDTIHPTTISCNMEKVITDTDHTEKFVSSDGKYLFSGGDAQSNTEHLSGKNSTCLDNHHLYGMNTGFAVKAGDAVYLTVWRKTPKLEGCIVMAAKDNSFYTIHAYIVTDSAGWKQIRCIANIPPDYKSNMLYAYLYYPGKEQAYFDDLEIKIYHRK
jgi:hypothetical protein